MPLSLVTFITSRAINEGVKSINECRKTGKDSGNPLTPLLWVREHSLMSCIFLGFTLGLLLILEMVVDLPLVEWLVFRNTGWLRLAAYTIVHLRLYYVFGPCSLDCSSYISFALSGLFRRTLDRSERLTT
jgi:hypothetical protein